MSPCPVDSILPKSNFYLFFSLNCKSNFRQNSNFLNKEAQLTITLKPNNFKIKKLLDSKILNNHGSKLNSILNNSI